MAASWLGVCTGVSFGAHIPARPTGLHVVATAEVARTASAPIPEAVSSNSEVTPVGGLAFPEAIHVADLEYREQSTPIVSSSVSFSPQSAPFTKEPAFGQAKIVRGILGFGSSPDEALPFVWDFTQRKLYLDLNRNRDLTDDGVQVSGDRSYGGNYYYQTFTNIHLSFKTPLGPRRLLADLSFHSYNNQPNVSAGCRSLWEGKLSLQGKDWQVGFIENLSGKFGSTADGYLLLRPWAARSKVINLHDGALDAFRICRNLFLEEQAYQVDCALVQRTASEGQPPRSPALDSASVRDADSPRFRLTLTEQATELGELRLPGKFIHRLLLTSDRGRQAFTLVLDNPEPAVKVPLGWYVPLVHLEQGGIEAHRAGYYFGWQPQGATVAVNAKSATTLRIGGPLTNTVSVSRQGRDLNLGYQLLGAGGEVYQLAGARKNPQFAIYQGGKQVASGKFEFG